MTLPNNFTPLTTAIYEMLLSGSGISPYYVSGSYYSNTYFYEDRLPEAISHDSLTKPQVKVKITSYTDANAWLKPSNIQMYDFNLAVDIAYHLENKLLRSKRNEIENKVANDSMYVQRALAHPHNLLTSSNGNETGLCSGRLKFESYSNPKFDYANGVATATILFSGKIVLSNSLGTMGS